MKESCIDQTSARKEGVIIEQRKTNIELLRIVSIFMIIVFHCTYKSGFYIEPGSGFSVNKLVLKSFWMLGELGVNLFMLISGYFMANGRFKWKKVVRQLVEVHFYHWLTLIIAIKIGAVDAPVGRDLFLTFFPVTMSHWWFITAYIMIYVLSPYLNILARGMDKKTYRKFLFILLTLFCVIPTFFGFFFNTTESMLFYNRFIWLLILYFLSIYIYIYGDIQEKRNVLTKINAVRLSVASAVVLILSILVIDRFSDFFSALGTTELAYFYPPNTIPILGLSVGIFVLFLRLEIPYNAVINAVASTTLGVYLLHESWLQWWLWYSVFRCAAYQGSPFLAFYILAVAAVILLFSVLIDLLRQQLEKRTLIPLLDAIGHCLKGPNGGNQT